MRTVDWRCTPLVSVYWRRAIFLIALTSSIYMCALAGPRVFAQSSDGKPLGDVAREQQQGSKQKKSPPGKVYSNEDLNPDGEAPGSDVAPRVLPPTPASGPPEKPQNESNATETAAPQTSAEVACPTRRADDRPANTEADMLVVPAGTQIKVQMSDVPWPAPPVCTAKVVWPVRVGFRTAIPASSIVTVQVTPSIYGWPDYYGYGWPDYYGYGWRNYRNGDFVEKKVLHSLRPLEQSSTPMWRPRRQESAMDIASKHTQTADNGVAAPQRTRQYAPMELMWASGGAGSMELTAVTLENVTYDLHTDVLPFVSASFEVTFTLLEPLQIPR
jgi:hypothetical protein